MNKDEMWSAESLKAMWDNAAPAVWDESADADWESEYINRHGEPSWWR